jgi:hypothetical protein
MKNLTISLLIVIALLLMHGLVDRFDRINDQRIAYGRWVADSCTPEAEGDRVTLRREGGRLRCTIFSGGGYGRAAPEMVSTATTEVPL